MQWRKCRAEQLCMDESCLSEKWEVVIEIEGADGMSVTNIKVSIRKLIGIAVDKRIREESERMH